MATRKECSAHYRHYVTPDYFKTLSMPLLRGRHRSRGRSRRTAARGDRFAERRASNLVEGDDVVGRRIRLGTAQNAPVAEIVGVVADARFRSLVGTSPHQAPSPTSSSRLRSAPTPISRSPSARPTARRSRLPRCRRPCPPSTQPSRSIECSASGRGCRADGDPDFRSHAPGRIQRSALCCWRRSDCMGSLPTWLD